MTITWNYNGMSKGGIIAQGTIETPNNSASEIVKEVGIFVSKKLKADFLSDDDKSLTVGNESMKVNITHYIDNQWSYTIDLT